MAHLIQCDRCKTLFSQDKDLIRLEMHQPSDDYSQYNFTMDLCTSCARTVKLHAQTNSDGDK